MARQRSSRYYRLTCMQHHTHRVAALEEAKAQLESQLRLQTAEIEKMPGMQEQLSAFAAQVEQAAKQQEEAVQVGGCFVFVYVC